MKLKLLVAFLAVLFSLPSFSQQGINCADPVFISLPFQVSSSTANFGDTYDTPQGLSCNTTPSTANYFAGNDVFYSFIADSNSIVNITMTPSAGNSAIFVYDYCSSIGNSCIAGMANSSSSPRNISFTTTVGQSYIIAISSSAATQTFSYNLLVQKQDCGPDAMPVNLNAVAGSTTATLSWSNPSINLWEVAFQNAGGMVPQPGDATEYVTSPSMVKTGLSGGNSYQFWVRGICSSGVFSAWAGPYSFETLLCNAEDKCNYAFSMSDSAGNGWNGAAMQVKQNGKIIPSTTGAVSFGPTYTSGAEPVYVTFSLCKDQPFEVYWLTAGTQPQQCILSIINSFDQNIYTKPAGIGTPGTTIYSGTVNCTTPSCDIVPSSLIASIGISTVNLSWSANGTSSWDIYIVSSGSPAPTASSTPSYNDITVNGFTPTGLLQNTAYDFYVRTNCAPAPTAWSQAATFVTPITCYQPTQLAVSGITQTAANVSWTKGMPADNNWDILLVPGPGTPVTPGENPSTANGNILVNTSVASAYAFTNLQSGTIYNYFIRTVCSVSDKSLWSGPFAFNTVLCDNADKCYYKFILTDTGSNGWNGARLQVRQNGIVVATLGSQITSSGPTTVLVALCTNVPFDVYWSVSGTANTEIGFSIQNTYVDTIYNYTPGSSSQGQVVYSGIANCSAPACAKPQTLTASGITSTSAQLSWIANNGETQWEVYAVPSGTAPPVNGSAVSGVGNYHIANTNVNFTVSGLLPATNYTFYVRSMCSPTSQSTWTLVSPGLYTPGVFTTKPVNDECATATVLAVNPTENAAIITQGTTVGATASPVTQECSGNADDDVWFSFTATSEILAVNISTTTPAYFYTTIYAGDCGTMTKLFCGGAVSTVASGLVVGQTYKVRVFSSATGAASNGSFAISVTTPAPVTNDECNTAIMVASTPITTATSANHVALAGATISAQTATCASNHDVWYKFIATGMTEFIAFSNITGTNDVIKYAVYSGDCNGLTQVSCGTTVSTYIVGQTYYLRLWTSSSSPENAAFDFTLTSPAPPLVVNPNLTATQLVTDVLVNNPCVSISNITSSTGTNYGSVNGLGYFTNPLQNLNFPISSGIVLSTGSAASAGGSNTSTLSEGGNIWVGDSQLENIILQGTGQTMSSYNATKLEFDFSSLNTFMSFNFLFASDEYGTYQCNYADAFAFLLTDLETNITINLAVIPGTTTPVSVITIRNNDFNTACISENEPYFDSFFGTGGENIYTSAINFNGQTQLMTASSPILPNHPYHIKLVVADRGDSLFDTAVFIQGGTFTSGPPECLDKLNLVAFLDANNNGIKDGTEPEFTYGTFNYDVNNSGTVTNISSPTGQYTIYDTDPSNVYDISYAMNAEMQPYFTVSGGVYNDVNIPAGSGTQILYFPVVLNQAFNDVTASIISMIPPRAGSTYLSKIVYKNLGIQAASGTINYTKDPLTDITSVSQSGIVNIPGGFTFDFTNLAPFETRSINVIQSVPAIPAVNIGDFLTNSVTISAPSNDINSSNNQFSLTQEVVAAYDPNDKMEAHGGKIAVNQFSNQDFLYYTIRFQNTGTANAINVRIEDFLDAQLNPATIRVISASHNYIMERIDNHVIWHFNYIQLPGMYQSEELSKGYVTFMIKPNAGFAAGDLIPNTADIYFDSNPAIVTNTFNTLFTNTLGLGTLNESNFTMYPNPAKDRLTISIQNSAHLLDAVIVYDMVGKKVKEVRDIAAPLSNINLTGLASGIYTVDIQTDNNFRVTRKLIIK